MGTGKPLQRVVLVLFAIVNTPHQLRDGGLLIAPRAIVHRQLKTHASILVPGRTMRARAASVFSHSGEASRAVPTHTPSVPAVRAAATPCAEAMPPAANTRRRDMVMSSMVMAFSP